MSYIKKPNEIEAIREAGRRMGRILEDLAKMVAPGVSAYDIDAQAERMIAKAGGKPAFKGYRARKSDSPFPYTICACVNEEVVHGFATKEKVLREGDIFSIDIGMEWPVSSDTREKGYFVDTALTVPVGEILDDAQKLIDVTREALEVGILAARPGQSIADIGRAIEQYVKSQGSYGIVRDLVGHGVGHAVHEDPRVPNFFDPDLEKWEVREGAVLALEPMITLGDYRVRTQADGWTVATLDGLLSAHFEHTIVIGAHGAEVVTRRPSENV